MHKLSSGYGRWTAPWLKHWLRPRTYTNWVRWYYQRATRGYADYDVWSFDDYLNEVIPNVLRRLKEGGHGHPISLTKEKWDKILDRMIAGFEANARVLDGLYEEELGDYFDRRERAEVSLIKRDEKLFKEGMELFVKYYNSLWD